MRSFVRSGFSFARLRAPLHGLIKVFSAIAVCLFAGAASGCALSFPIPAIAEDARDDVTGSIPKSAASAKDAPISSSLDVEDWRRARAALATALDPQGSGMSVAWSNPASLMRGSITPVSLAYPQDGYVCRAFSAKIEGGAAPESVRGTACRINAFDWIVEEAKKEKKR